MSQIIRIMLRYLYEREHWIYIVYIDKSGPSCEGAQPEGAHADEFYM